MPRDIPREQYVGRVPTPFAVYRPANAFGALAFSPPELGVAMLDGAPEITPAQLAAHPAVQALLADTAKQAAEAAVRALNTPAEGDRPGGAGSPLGANVNLNRVRQPSIAKAIRALSRHSWKGAELERDLSQATRALVPFNSRKGDDDEEGDYANGLTLPTTRDAYMMILEETGIKTEASEFAKFAARAVGQYDAAIAVRALGEGTSALGSVTSAGALVPIQFLTDQFVLALTSAIVLRQMPEVTVVPVTSNIIELPRESAAAAASAVAESGTITPNDPTLALQEFAIKKQARLQLFSNELLNDSNPAINTVINRMLARDIALFQDAQYLEGSGSGANVNGLANYSGFTTSSWVAATNGSTPGADDLINMAFDIYGANANPTAFIGHPRSLKNVLKLKDASGRYLFTSYASWGGPRMLPIEGTSMTYPSKAVGDLNGIPFYLSTQISVARTQGSSSAATNIYYGDFTKCLILERQAVDIFLSEHYAMNADQTAVRVTARSTVALTQPTAFAKATGII
jgi:HK97 family phage major capsid protein